MRESSPPEATLPERPRRQARVGGQPQLDGIAPARAERRLGDRDLEARAVHAHVREVALDAARERLRRLLPSLVEGSREALRRLLGRGDRGRGARDALVGAHALGQLRRGRLGARAQVGGLVDAAEAPAQLGELLETLLDAVEHGRVGVETAEVGAQLHRGLAQLLGDARELVARAGERGVVLAHPPQRVRCLARERDGARALVGIEQLRGFLGGLAQDVEMAQAAALAREAVLLPGLRVDLLDRVGERLQLRQPSLLVGGAGLGLGERAPRGDERAPGGAHLGAQRAERSSPPEASSRSSWTAGRTSRRASCWETISISDWPMRSRSSRVQLRP